MSDVEHRSVSFANTRIAPESLPALAREPFEPVEHAWLRMRMTSWGFVLIPAIAASIGLYFADVPRWAMILPIVAGLIISGVGIAIEQRAFGHRGWLLRERDISSRHGLISRETTTAPFSRVQHVKVNQGGLSRLFGVARINVYTAGAGLADLSIEGLTMDDAERLKAQIIEQSQMHDNRRMGQPAVEVEPSSG